VGKALERAWAMGAGPDSDRLLIDVDSTVCEVAGKAKARASYAYTKVLGSHPILASRADTGEILHALRTGSANTARGTKGFVESSSPGSAAPAPAVRSWPASTPGTGQTTPSPPSVASTCATRWRCEPEPKARPAPSPPSICAS
jgi:hypothetical protein